MAIKRKAGGRITGLAADSKPTAAAEPINTIFQETDTHTEYINNGSAWNVFSINQTPYSYIVYKEGSTYYAKSKNLTNYSNTAAHTTIESAINALHTAGGGRIFFKSGTYTITDDIDFAGKNYIIFEGEQRDSTTFVCGTTNIGMFINGSATAIQGIAFRNLTVDGANISNHMLNTSDNLSWLEIDNCVFKRGNVPTTVQIYGAGLSYAKVTNSQFIDANASGDLLAISGNKLWVEGCYFRRSVFGGGLTSGGHNEYTVINNKWEDYTGYGGCTVENSLAGTVSTDTIIANNIFENAATTGAIIKIQDEAGATTATNNLTIIGNQALNSGPIEVHRYVHRMNISHNILDGIPANQAILVYSYNTEAIISNNIIRNSLRGIIYVQPETVASQQIQIVGNNIADTSYEGIEVRGVKYCIIANNMLWNCGKISNAAQRGIWVQTNVSPCDYVKVHGNMIGSNHANKMLNAILADSGSTHTTISENMTVAGSCTSTHIVPATTTGGITVRNNDVF